MTPIFRPFMPEGITPEIQSILYSGQLAYGKYGRMFEESLTRYLGNELCLTTSSHNHAMLVAISTLGLQPGDEVIASPVSCLASNQPFATKGLSIVWADVNPHTGVLCHEDVKSKITSRTKAIVHNHYCGYVGNAQEILRIGQDFGIAVIDDCIEAFGSESHGRKLGSVSADVTVFSFQAVRLPNTIDGGALAFKSPELFEKARLVRDYGIDRSRFRDVDNEIDPSCDIELEGYGATMNEVSSYIGVQQLLKIEEVLRRQRANAEVWNRQSDRLADHGLNSLPITSGTVPNYWVYGLMADDGRKAIHLLRKAGVHATSVHVNNNRYSVFRNSANLAGVDEFMKRFVAVPCGWWVEDLDIERTIDLLASP